MSFRGNLGRGMAALTLAGGTALAAGAVIRLTPLPRHADTIAWPCTASNLVPVMSWPS
jgi:hypothetical protein